MYKRILVYFAIIIYMSAYIFPIVSFSISEASPDDKIIASSGDWQNDYYTNVQTGQTKFYSAYIGNKKASSEKKPEPFKFSISRDTKLIRVHVVHKSILKSFDQSNLDNNKKNENAIKNTEPIAKKEAQQNDILISVDTGDTGINGGLGDSSKVFVQFFEESNKRKLYGPFEAKLDNIALESEGKKPETITATVVFGSSVILPEGKYSMEVSNPDAALFNKDTKFMPASMIVGIDNEAWERYEKNRNSEIVGKNDNKNSQNSETDIDKMIEIGKAMAELEGDQIEEKKGEEATGKKPQFKDAEIELTADAYIDAIQTDHFNGGSGAAPGTIGLLGGPKGQTKQYGPWNAKGSKSGNLLNAVWTVSPDIVVPAGKYKIIDSDTNTLSYDLNSMEPVFYIRAVDPPPFDFTGTYFINIKTAITASINKSKIGQPSKFDRDGFELTVIDKGDVMELIGKYTQEKKKDIYFGSNTTEYDFKDVPFSQICKVISRDGNKAKVEFSFNMDLTKLPYKARVGASVLIDFDASGGSSDKYVTNVTPVIKASGSAFYNRPYTDSYGGDQNEYSVSVSGQRASVQLPPFVVAQITKAIRMGNIPGPRNDKEATTGLLFPPLAGLILHIALTMKKSKIIRQTDEDGDSGKSSSSGSKSSSVSSSDSEDSSSEDSSSEDSGSEDGSSEDSSSEDSSSEDSSSGDSGSEDSSDAGPESDSGGESSDGETGQSGSSFGETDGGSNDTDVTDPDSDNNDSNNTDNSGQDNNDEYGGGSYNPDVIGEQMGKYATGELATLQKEKDEWMANLKSSMESADPEDPAAQKTHQQYKDYIDSLDSRISDINAIVNQPPKPATMTFQVDFRGRTAEVAYDSATDQYYNVETGNIFDMETYEKVCVPQFDKDKAWVERARQDLETRNTDFDRGMDKLVSDNNERARLLQQLQRARNNSYGVQSAAPGVGDVRSNIDKLTDKLIYDRNANIDDLKAQASRISKVITGQNSGRTAGFDAIEKANQGLSYTSLIGETLVEGSKDVVQGRTWAGMAGRMALAGVTGGMSEVPLNVGEAMLNIKDSIDDGESGGRAVAKAIGMYVTGELGGEYLGAAWKKTGLQVNPDLVKKVTDFGNTPVSKLLNRGSVSGTRNALENVVTGAQKSIMGSADAGSGKSLKEVQDYLNYKDTVKGEANIVENAIKDGKQLSPDEIRKVLRDPSISRELKGRGIDVQTEYKKMLDEGLYKPANTGTTNALKSDPSVLSDIQKKFGPDAKITNVSVDTIRTPGSKSIMNADNDIAGTLTVVDKDGIVHRVELPTEKVAPIYNEKFAEASGMIKADGTFDVAKAKLEMGGQVPIVQPNGKTQMVNWENLSKEKQIEVFSAKHNQEITNVKTSTEAAGDFSTSGKLGTIDNVDANTLANGRTSNVANVKAGITNAKLDDPAGLANMERYKVSNYMNKSEIASNAGGLANKAEAIAHQTEAYEQLAKMGNLTNDLTSGYAKLGYNPNPMPDNMAKALEIVNNRNLSPGMRSAGLQKLGFDGPTDLADKLSGRIEGLQKLGTGGKDTKGDKILKNVLSLIVRKNTEKQINEN